jgi:metallophosphoesterase superfamily enzyme
MLLLNDIHIGVQRKGGTTPASSEAMRSYLFDSLRGVLGTTAETHLVIVGDLFDQFSVSERDWLDTYMLLQSWLFDNPDRKLTLIAGNHDHQP